MLQPSTRSRNTMSAGTSARLICMAALTETSRSCYTNKDEPHNVCNRIHATFFKITATEPYQLSPQY